MKYVLRTPKQIVYPNVHPEVTNPAMTFAGHPDVDAQVYIVIGLLFL